MSIFSFLSKIPWLFLISRTPQIIKTVENLSHRKKIENILSDPNKNDFAALEKFMIEQARLLATNSDNIEKLTYEMKEVKENLSFLFLISIFSFILTIITAVIVVFIYFNK